MNSVFVDTSAFYAVLDRDDANHGRAADIWARILPAAKLVTHNYAVVETMALVQRRLGFAAVRTFVQDVLPLAEVVWVTEATHRAGTEAMLASGRKDLSLVDCVSFITMRGLELDTAFCFDADFRRQGFLML